MLHFGLLLGWSIDYFVWYVYVYLYVLNKYGRAIWGCVKMFVDPRSQEKVLLYSCKDDLPKEISQLIDPSEISVCCGGTCVRPIMNLMDTFQDE